MADQGPQCSSTLRLPSPVSNYVEIFLRGAMPNLMNKEADIPMDLAADSHDIQGYFGEIWRGDLELLGQDFTGIVFLLLL